MERAMPRWHEDSALEGRRVLCGQVFGAGAMVLIIAGFAVAQTIAPVNSPPNPYRSIEHWGTLPEGRAWGSTSAVAIDPDGTSVWVGERCGESRPPSQVDPSQPFGCDGSK